MLAFPAFKGQGRDPNRRRIRKGRAVATAKVEIYTKMFCGYCFRAKRLLASKGVEYVEYDITLGGEKRDEMRARAPEARTVPQIFIDDVGVGGSDDLARLEREGKLDALLGL
jgi:glutaredoxin 3